jgi:hypothetical protein
LVKSLLTDDAPIVPDSISRGVFLIRVACVSPTVPSMPLMPWCWHWAGHHGLGWRPMAAGWTALLPDVGIAPLRPAKCGFKGDWSAHFVQRFAGTLA